MLEALYNLFLHPLRSYPGPKLWAVSQIPYARISVSGQGHRKMLELHKIYGPVIRIGPNAVSYNHPEAMTAIRGHRRGGMAEHGKDPDLFGSHRLSILGADRDNHRRYRQILAHGFSAQTMLEQQPIIKSYIDSFIARIREESAGGVQPIDMVKWYNYTTFDIIGDLSFGEPFGCLQGSTYHPWVAMIFSSVKGLAISAHLERILHNQMLKKLFMPTNLAASLAESRQLATAKVRKRLATQTDRPDFINAMIKRSGSKGKVSNCFVPTVEQNFHKTLYGCAGQYDTPKPYALNPPKTASLIHICTLKSWIDH
jgi:cytochrome P450